VETASAISTVTSALRMLARPSHRSDVEAAVVGLTHVSRVISAGSPSSSDIRRRGRPRLDRSNHPTCLVREAAFLAARTASHHRGRRLRNRITVRAAGRARVPRHWDRSLTQHGCQAQRKASFAGVDVDFMCGDAADAPALDDRSIDVVLARHLVWTLPDPHASFHAWIRLLRLNVTWQPLGTSGSRNSDSG
jgi:hypothetical protein